MGVQIFHDSHHVIWKTCKETALMKLLVDVTETLPAPVEAGANNKHVTLCDLSAWARCLSISHF